MNGWPRTPFGQIQDGQSDGQAKPPWPGASRIKIKHAVDSLDPRPMRVARNHRVNSAGCGIQPHVAEVVHDADKAPAEPYHRCVGIAFGPMAGINVPSDRSHRRNPAESRDHVRPTDVARVHDMRHPSQQLFSLGTQEAMSI